MKKHIVCLGDSNTHGRCVDLQDSQDGTIRFNENERWTCLLQKHLGEEYLVLEEGLSGRTMTVQDPMCEGIPALDVVFPILKSHEPVDLLIIMLGTNDTKDRFGLSPACIASCMNRLLSKVKTIPCWSASGPNILVICPPHIGEGMLKDPCAATMGTQCVEKSRALARFMEPVVKEQNCRFLDAEGVAEMNTIDCMHLSRKGHAQLAQKLSEIVREMV